MWAIVIEKLFGEDVVNELRIELCSTSPTYVAGELELSELGLAAVVMRLRDSWVAAIEGGMQPGFVTFATVLRNELESLAAAVREPWAGMFYRASVFIGSKLVDMNDAYMIDIAWGEALDRAFEHVARYETEKERNWPLTAGEFWYSMAMMMHTMRDGLSAYKSPNMPSGIRNPEHLRTFAHQTMLLLFSMSRWYGCWRGPRTYWDEPIPDGYDPPYSVGF